MGPPTLNGNNDIKCPIKVVDIIEKYPELGFEIKRKKKKYFVRKIDVIMIAKYNQTQLHH